jgi:CO/xanthine dehydrogenase Mo-binding subunit
MGIGYALTEELLFADDKVTTRHFGDYKIPTASRPRWAAGHSTA